MSNVPSTNAPSSGAEAHLTTPELAERWRVAAESLTNLRSLKKGPPYVKLGDSTVRYRLSDILQYESDSLVTPAAS